VHTPNPDPSAHGRSHHRRMRRRISTRQSCRFRGSTQGLVRSLVSDHLSCKMSQVGAGLRMLWLTQLFRRHPSHRQARTSPRRGIGHLTHQHQICHPTTKTEIHPHPRTTNPNLTHRSRQHIHHSHWWACPPRCRIGTSTTRRPHPHPQSGERNQRSAISPYLCARLDSDLIFHGTPTDTLSWEDKTFCFLGRDKLLQAQRTLTHAFFVISKRMCGVAHTVRRSSRKYLGGCGSTECCWMY